MIITIINQHTLNHGDEAAAKALYKALHHDKIEKLNILHTITEADLFQVKKLVCNDKNQNHYAILQLRLFEKVILIASLFFPYFLSQKLIRLSKALSKELDIIKFSKKIISAPGGVNLGPYKDWRYLWRLYVAIKERKEIAVYSISYGPLPDIPFFRKKSQYVLNGVKFLSLRDKKSQEFAKQANIDFIPAIDTAFLYNDYDSVDIPSKYHSLIKKNFIVIVPNELYIWHPNFKNIKPEILDDKYIKIFNYFLDRGFDIVCLPQLFGRQNDKDYMARIKKQLGSENIHIFNEQDSSDIQQAIIAKSQFVIGARYHSIIFAINNNIPFVSLAYEHKMTNTLELLGLQENNIMIEDMLDNDDYIEKIDNLFSRRDEIARKVCMASEKAHKIATTTYDMFKKNFLMS